MKRDISTESKINVINQIILREIQPEIIKYLLFDMSPFTDILQLYPRDEEERIKQKIKQIVDALKNYKSSQQLFFEEPEE